MLDVGGQDLEVFHAGSGVCGRGDGELVGVQRAAGAVEYAEEEGGCGLAVDFVAGGGLEGHGWDAVSLDGGLVWKVETGWCVLFMSCDFGFDERLG